MLLLFIILWIVLRSKWLWVSVIALLLGIQQIVAVFSFHLSQDFSDHKPPNTLRILQWNVMGWDQGNEKNKIENGMHALRPVMMDVVQAQDADILCFEEFFEPQNSIYFKSNIAIITKMGYPYHFFVPAKNYENDSTSGIVILSKHPIIDTGRFDLDRSKNGDRLIYADVKVKDTIFRVFATHLIAINFAQWDDQQYSQTSGSKDYETLFSKLIRGYTFRYYQAELVQQKIAESPYPVIICGDFNDIPNSSTYFKIKGNLQDPFLKKGYWTGRTTRRNFIFFSPRIDYILADRKFKVTQYQTIHVPYSDHFPIKTDLRY